MNTKTSIYDYDNDFAHYELDEKEVGTGLDSV